MLSLPIAKLCVHCMSYTLIFLHGTEPDLTITLLVQQEGVNGKSR